jgi:hypothetical protein
MAASIRLDDQHLSGAGEQLRPATHRPEDRIGGYASRVRNLRTTVKCLDRLENRVDVNDIGNLRERARERA